MLYLRKWFLPTISFTEHLEFPEGYGQSYFWYCIHCRELYATAELQAENCQSRPWRGLGGVCFQCPQHKYLIRGDLPAAPDVMAHYPQPVMEYLLEREIDFLGHREHPHNEGIIE